MLWIQELQCRRTWRAVAREMKKFDRRRMTTPQRGLISLFVLVRVTHNLSYSNYCAAPLATKNNSHTNWNLNFYEKDSVHTYTWRHDDHHGFHSEKKLCTFTATLRIVRPISGMLPDCLSIRWDEYYAPRWRSPNVANEKIVNYNHNNKTYTLFHP